MMDTYIKKLVMYGVETGLVPAEDVIFTVNRLLELFKLEGPEDESFLLDGSSMPEDEDTLVSADGQKLEEILSGMLDYACDHGLITENSVVYRDLFDTKIMSLLMPRPSG